MTDTRARVGVVVAKRGADHFLDQIRLLVGATRRGDASDRIAPVLCLDPFEFARGMSDSFFPAHLAPWVGELGADHRFRDAVFVGGIAPGEPALHAGMA